MGKANYKAHMRNNNKFFCHNPVLASLKWDNGRNTKKYVDSIIFIVFYLFVIFKTSINLFINTNDILH